LQIIQVFLLAVARIGSSRAPESAQAEICRSSSGWCSYRHGRDQVDIEKFKKRIACEIEAALSVKVILKETFTRFKVTDPKLLLVSVADPTVIISTAEDLDKIPSDAFPILFPADVKNGKTWMSLFLVSEMPIGRLKRFSFGFHEHASKKAWMQESRNFQSMNVRKIGFFIRKDPRKTNRDIFATQLSENLSSHPHDAEGSSLCQEANEALPFDGNIPAFRLKLATRIHHGTAATGVIHTAGILVQCDQQHVAFLTGLLIHHYENGDKPELFVPCSMLHGDDPTNHRACRNAIILQNKCLSEVKVSPVIGISPKALKEKITVGNDPEPVSVLNVLNQCSHFTSMEPAPQSETIGKYFFLTTKNKFTQAKEFITNTLPQLWAKLDDTFLHELPASVQVPRLAENCANLFSLPQNSAVVSPKRISQE
jgi:hypothetical protein